MKIPAAFATLFLALVCGCGDGGSTPPAPVPETGPAASGAPSVPAVRHGSGRPQVALIPLSAAAEEWRVVHAGAAKAISEMKKGANGKPIMDIAWSPAGKTGAAADQVGVAQKLIDDGVAAIVFTPDSAEALQGVTHAAAAKRIPVIAVNSAFGLEGCKAGISFDDAQVGELAAQKLSAAKGGRWVVFPGGQEPVAGLRAQAFRAAVASSMATVVTGEQTAEAIASLANGATAPSATLPVTAIFAPDEASTLAALAALEEAKLAGKVPLVGVGTTAKLTAALQAKEISALVVTDPFEAGYIAVRTAADCIREKKVEKSMVVPVHLVTPENMGEAAIVPLLDPPVGKYLQD